MPLIFQKGNKKETLSGEYNSDNTERLKCCSNEVIINAASRD